MDSSNFYHDHNKYNVNRGNQDHGSSSYSDDAAISIQEDDEDDQSNSKRGRNSAS